MGKSKNGLEKKLTKGINVTMKSNLGYFVKILRKDYKVAKKKEYALLLTCCMLGRMYDGNNPGRFISRQIHTVGELYSYTEREMLYGFRGFGKQSLMKLSEHLIKYELPPLKLPQKWL